MNWSDEAVSRMTELRGEGVSWDDIARRLTREFGVHCSPGSAERKMYRTRQANGEPKHVDRTFWTQERTDKLIADWNATGSEARTAEQIGQELGQTRSAICGKVKRLREKGVHMVAKTNGHNGTTRKSRKCKRTREQNSADGGHAIRAAKARQRAMEVRTEAKAPEPDLAPLKRPRGGVPFIEAKAHHCRWPLWDSMSDPRHVCGAEALFDKPYCDEHAKRARSQHQPEAKTRPARRQR